ncbi:unnamed protein product [Ostreobium quekettii]|uniref:Beta-lactamase n=1 Tax=Ostreobium quekettii TaxID=121088 RepID=A0A8S1JA16_9CHLO|nr:unnamed protein product [Ostreobium quekettii]
MPSSRLAFFVPYAPLDADLAWTACLGTSCSKTPPLITAETITFEAPQKNARTWSCGDFYELNVKEGFACTFQECPTGQEKDPDHSICCWPGQTYDEAKGECAGELKCPEGTEPDYHSTYCTPIDGLAWYGPGCEAGKMSDCSLLGKYLEATNSHNPEPDYKLARHYFERACRGGLIDGCERLANNLLRFDKSAETEKLTAALFELSCDGADRTACLRVGNQYLLEREIEAALDALDRGCQELKGGESRQSIISCQRRDLYKLLGAQDPEQITTYIEALEERCQRTSYNQEQPGYVHACTGLLRKALKERKDTSTYEERMEKACEDGYWYACSKLGSTLYYNSPTGEDASSRRDRYARAVPPLERACSKGNNASACTLLRKMADAGKGLPSTRKEKLARRERACQMGSQSACYDHAVLLYRVDGTAENHRATLEAFERACELPDYRACTFIGIMMSRGHGVEMKEKTRKRLAARYFERECLEHDEKIACDWLGYIHQYGEGVEPDKDKAKDYYTRACRQGNPSGCRNLLGVVDVDDIDDGALFSALLESSNEDDAPPRVFLFTMEEFASSSVPQLETLENGIETCRASKAECARLEKRFSKLVESAKKTFTQACEGGEGKACWYVSKMLDNRLGGLEYDEAEQQRILDLGCRHDDAASCFRAGKNHYFSYWTAESRREDGVELLARSCTSGKDLKRCLIASHAVIETSGDVDRARDLIETVCTPDIISELSCERLVQHWLRYPVEHSPLEARAYLESRCEQGDEPSCALVARQLFAKDPARALALVPETCTPETSPALCIERAWQLLQTPETVARGVEQLERWCEEEEYPRACHDLGMHHRKGTTLGKHVLSREALETGCDHGSRDACFEVGQLYESGNEFLKADKERAREFYLDACRYYHREGCMRHDMLGKEK